MSHLATGYYTVASGSGSGSPKAKVFLLVARFPLPIPNPRLFLFVVGLTAYEIELLDELGGKAMVASVQRIAFRDSEQSS
jgi:hypothetical protein